jgi:hypothetical protein
MLPGVYMYTHELVRSVHASGGLQHGSAEDRQHQASSDRPSAYCKAFHFLFVLAWTGMLISSSR